MSPYIDHIKLYTDAGCRPNPGPAAIGILILNAATNDEIGRYSELIGHTTAPQAEYQALKIGLRKSTRMTRIRVDCFTDSIIVAKQMNGEWRFHKDELVVLSQEITARSRLFQRVTYQHVPRTHQFIQIADRIVNDAFQGNTVDTIN